MKLTILKEKLVEGINVVGRISQKNLSLPILQNVLLETEKNYLKLTTTNLETGINWWTLAKIEKEGRICIPTQLLSNLLSLLPNKAVNLETKDLTLTLECENSTSKLKGFNPEDFPILPQPPSSETAILNSSTLYQALNQLLNIPSPSMARPEISGISFSFFSDSIKIVATDSFRLAEKTIFLKTGLSKDYSFILPQAAAKEIVRIFSVGEGDLKVYLSPNQAFFESQMLEVSRPQVQFSSRLIEGEYPNYQEIVPKKFETRLFIPKEAFLNQVKIASLFSGKINEIKLKISPKIGGVEVLSQSPDLGEHTSCLEGQVEGKEISVSFNHRFLIDGILEVKSKDLIFELTNEEGPAALKPADNQDFLYILMPIKAS